MRSSPHPAVVFAAIFVAIFLLHVPLLSMPYFWDEAGYYVPAARDLLLTGSLIPHTTVSNAHPPLVLAWIALWWKLVGYAPVVTRSAILRFISGVRPSTQVICTCGISHLLGMGNLRNLACKTRAFYRNSEALLVSSAPQGLAGEA